MKLVLLTLDVLALVGVITAGQLIAVRNSRASTVAYSLRFPRGLDAAEVEAFLSGLSGLLLPWWRRWLTTPVVILEVHATRAGITHSLTIHSRWASVVENLMQGSIPALRYERIDALPVNVRYAVEYRITDHARSLRVDAGPNSTKLLASLQPIYGDTEVVVQWLLTPHPPVGPVKVVTNAKSESPWQSLTSFAQDSEAASAKRIKYDRPLLLGATRIGVVGDDIDLCRSLIRSVEVAWHESRAPGVHLQRRTLPAFYVARRMRSHLAPLTAWPMTLNVGELAGLIGWPVDTVAVPGLVLGAARVLPASPLISRTGTVIGDSNFPGDLRPLALDTEARLRHLHVLGPTGTGKSTLLVNMALQDIGLGRGVVVLDPKRDLIEAILQRYPDDRRDDLVILDPADSERPVGLNPLQSLDDDHAEVVVENLVGLFKSLYRNSWGPRLDDILRAALLTLAGVPGSTLCEVALILRDPSYRRRIVGRLDDPVGLESFWGWYEGLSDEMRQTAISPVLNKLSAFTMRPRVRSIIGQSRPRLSLRDVFTKRRVILVSLATGLLGEEAASLLGALVVSELWHATLARAGHDQAKRHPVMAYLDEWQHFLHLPTSMANVLAEARGLGLGMVLAHQHLDQLPEDSRKAVLANARSRISFQLSASDARLVARESGDIFTADDFQGLGAFEIEAQLFAAGNTQPAATGTTRPLPPRTADAQALRTLSRQHFGVDRAAIEQEIRNRQHTRTDAPTGRRRRDGGQL
jgi:hypothetical protein